MNKLSDIKKMLDRQVSKYNCIDFIANDPISVPHRFTKLQDVEIAALFAALFAWGNRTTIINKANELMQLFDNAPHDFLLQHQPNDLKRFLHFKHRTFNADDTLYFIHKLSTHYKAHNSLETAFFNNKNVSIEVALNNFKAYFFDDEHLQRTRKHVSSPAQKSACKRLNMLLRWMVRKDDFGVDFGLWKSITPAQLICPLDLHVGNVARQLGLIDSKNNDWQTAVLLTETLSSFDMQDPVKYDFALFSIGVNQ